MSAYSKDKHFSLLTSLGKALCGLDQHPGTQHLISAAMEVASRVAEAIRVQIWSVTACMHMARGLVRSI